MVKLYEAVYGRSRSEEEARWKLLRPAPFSTVWLADAHGEIVGQHAGIPTRVKLGQTQLEAVQAVEAMTHPAYRRQGMLTVLGSDLYSHWRASGVPFVLGLPHAGWGSRADALGYRPFASMTWVSRPLRPVRLALARLLPAGNHADSSLWQTWRESHGPLLRQGDVSVSELTEADNRFDALWNDAESGYMFAVVRDREWVGWRFLSRPSNPYTVLMATRNGTPIGYVAYRLDTLSGRGVGRLADLFVARGDPHAAGVLLKAAHGDLEARGALSVSMLVADGTWLHTFLRSRGYLFNRGSYTLSVIPFSEDALASIPARRDKMQLCGGDFDVL